MTAYSLHHRLLWTLGAAFAALLGGTALWLEREVADASVAEFDAALLAQVQVLAALTEQEDGRIEFDYEAKFFPQFERDERPDVFQFWLEDGTVLLRSRHLGDDLPRDVLAGARDVALPGERRGRVRGMAFVPKGPVDVAAGGSDDDQARGSAPGVVLAVARGRERLDQLLARQRLWILGLGALAVAAAVVAVWWLLRRGLRPLDALAGQVAGLDPHAPGARVVLADPPRELVPVVEQLDALLVRAEAAMQRERRFTGHVTHELRTPIAELRALAAVGRRWPGDSEAVAGYFDDVDDIAGHMQGVISDLLLLARCGAGVEAVESAPVALGATVSAAWEACCEAAAARGVRLDARIDADLTVDADPGKLAIALTNLLSNAVAHGVPGTPVTCASEVVGDRVRLRIENRIAAPLPADELERLAEPFWRGERSATSHDHAGLGLALVSALAGLLGLRISFSCSDGGFVATVDGLGTESQTQRAAPASPPGAAGGGVVLPIACFPETFR